MFNFEHKCDVAEAQMCGCIVVFAQAGEYNNRYTFYYCLVCLLNMATSILGLKFTSTVSVACTTKQCSGEEKTCKISNVIQGAGVKIAKLIFIT